MRYLLILLLLCGICNAAITEWIVSAGTSAAADNGGKYSASYVGTTAQFLGADDGPVDTVTNGVYTDATGVLHLDGAFANTLVGMGIYIVSGTNMTAGRYIITTRISDDEVVIDGPTFGAGTDNSTDVHAHIGGAITWEALRVLMTAGAAAAGDRFNVKAGTYAVGTQDTWSNDGLATSPICVRGFQTSIGDLVAVGRTNSNGTLITTNYPVIQYADTKSLNAGGCDYVVFKNLKITYAASEGKAGGSLIVGTWCVVESCSVTNNKSASSSTAAAIIGNVGANVIMDCDALATGATQALSALDIAASDKAIGNHVWCTSTIGIRCTGANIIVLDNVIHQAGTDGIYYSSTTTTYVTPVIYGNTIYACGSDGIAIADAANTRPLVVVNNHITDCAAYGINQIGATVIPAVIGYNRFRDNATADINGFTDWRSVFSSGDVASGATGDKTTDFVDADNGDFEPASTNPGLGLGLPTYRDMGALQRVASSGSSYIYYGMDGGF